MGNLVSSWLVEFVNKLWHPFSPSGEHIGESRPAVNLKPARITCTPLEPAPYPILEPQVLVIMKQFFRSLFSLLAIGSVAISTASAEMQSQVPAYRAEDPAAAAVTLVDAYQRERFWPPFLTLTEKPATLPALAAVPEGFRGTLLRIEEDGRARIDFGRDGLHLVPLAATDFVERADMIRRGFEKKDAPNFTMLIGARLISSDTDMMIPFPFAAVTGQKVYVCLFVSTEGDALERMVGGLGNLFPKPGVMPMVFPLGEQRDSMIRTRLREAKQPWAFVHDHLSDSYAAGLLPSALPAPAILCLSPEGRVLAALPWNEEAVDRVRNAIQPFLQETATPSP